MRKFLLKLVLFSSCLPIYFGLNSLLNYIQYSSQTPKWEHYKVIIAGDSHPQTAIDPSHFQSARSIAQSAEPYYLTYWKLQKLAKLHKPDTLLLGFGTQNISFYNDYKLTDSNWSSELFKRIYPFHRLNELPSWIPIDQLAHVKTYLKYNGFFPNADHIHYMGGFDADDESKWRNCDHVVKRHYHLYNQPPHHSKTALNYLDSIVLYCEQTGIQLGLVTTPIHAVYSSQVPERITITFDSLKIAYADRALILDYTRFALPESQFYNCDHLNEEGASIFTQALVNDLANLH